MPDTVAERPTIPLYSLKRLQDLQTHTLGHYELGLVLGKSHHGVVFRRLRDLKTGRTVAIKVLALPDFPSDTDRGSEEVC